MALRSTLMETYEYRRKRLRKLLQDEYGDNQSEFARRVDVSHTTINYFLSARTTIGERRARRIEEKLDLPAGWLDQPIQRQDRSGDRRGSKPKRPQRVALSGRDQTQATGAVPAGADCIAQRQVALKLADSVWI